MNNCEQWQDLISAAEPLSNKDTAALEAHLRECPACRRYRDALSVLSDFAVEDTPALPSDFTDRVMSSVRRTAEEKKKRQLRRLMTRWGSLAAALVVAFLGVRQLLPSRPAAHAKMAMPVAAPAAAESFAVTEESIEEPAEAAAGTYFDTADMDEDAETEAVANNELMLFAMNAAVPDDAAFLEESVFPGSQPAEEAPEGDWDCSLSDGDTVCCLWLRDGKVFWQLDGEETVYLSPAGAEDVENYIYG